MKYVKGISLFCVYPLAMFGVGFLCGMLTFRSADANDIPEYVEESPQVTDPEYPDVEQQEEQIRDVLDSYEAVGEEETLLPQSTAEAEGDSEDELLHMVSRQSDRINADTEYILEEVDLVGGSTVETKWSIPEKYIGMNRETFLVAMESYEANPPLSELERGFESLEVLAFSAEQVRVQMNYRYVEPGTSFYLMVYDGKVVVYQEDMHTVYLYTDISVQALPESLQQKIIQGMFLEDEENLYDFLENYTT